MVVKLRLMHRGSRCKASGVVVRSLGRRFRGWQAWQQAPADAALAMLHLLLAADRCALSSQRRATSGGSVLGAALLLLPILLTSGATLLLQVCGPTSFILSNEQAMRYAG